MISRAEASFFWPGITKDIHTIGTDCSHCNQMAPSQPALHPIPLILAVYPFQCMYWFFSLPGDELPCHCGPILKQANSWKGLKWIEGACWSAPMNICYLWNTGWAFLWLNSYPTWPGHFCLTGVSISSVAFSHSNCRAEVGAKTVKQLIAVHWCNSCNLTTRFNLITDVNRFKIYFVFVFAVLFGTSVTFWYLNNRNRKINRCVRACVC